MCSDTRETLDAHPLHAHHGEDGTMIQIVTGDPRPIFRQIVDGLRRRIASGELPAGSRLPSVRGLALQLRISLNTVAKAYTQLTTEGLIESRRGVGVFVCEPKQMLNDDERQRRLDEAVETFVNATLSLGFEADEISQRLLEEYQRLQGGKPDESGS